jgi:nickel superoxide dismutase
MHLRLPLATAALMFTLGWSALAGAHCQIPCGIYDDELRARLIGEHITTIEKSMNTIAALAEADDLDANQLTRWVANKDHHADELTGIVTAYFLAQRLKPADLDDDAKKDAYLEQLTLLHAMMFHAMKAKQTTDLTHVQTLRDLLQQFEIAYFGHEVAGG